MEKRQVPPSAEESVVEFKASKQIADFNPSNAGPEIGESFGHEVTPIFEKFDVKVHKSDDLIWPSTQIPERRKKRPIKKVKRKQQPKYYYKPLDQEFTSISDLSTEPTAFTSAYPYQTFDYVSQARPKRRPRPKRPVNPFDPEDNALLILSPSGFSSPVLRRIKQEVGVELDIPHHYFYGTYF